MNSSIYYIPPDFKYGPKTVTETPHEKDNSLLIFLTFWSFTLSFIIFGTLYNSIKHSRTRERWNAQENLEYDLEMQ